MGRQALAILRTSLADQGLAFAVPSMTDAPALDLHPANGESCFRPAKVPERVAQTAVSAVIRRGGGDEVRLARGLMRSCLRVLMCGVEVARRRVSGLIVSHDASVCGCSCEVERRITPNT